MRSTIFVVDDEPVIVSTLAEILRRNGYWPTTFTSPRAVLAAAQSNTPDMLLADIAMPGISGIELAIQVKAACPACKILLLSAVASARDLLKDAASQGHDFSLLDKPVHPDELLSKVRELASASNNTCPQYQLLKRDYESALGEAKVASVYIWDRMKAHCIGCPVCENDQCSRDRAALAPNREMSRHRQLAEG